MRQILFVVFAFFASAWLQAGQAPGGNPQFSHFKFMENKGQWESGLLFKAEANGAALYMLRDRIRVLQYDADALPVNHHNHHGAESDALNQSVPAHYFDIQFLEANENPAVTGLDPYLEQTNFLYGSDPTDWVQNASSYRKIKYAELYKGIDFTLSNQQGVTKYEFLLAPRAKAKHIQLRYSGVQNMQVQQGRLVYTTRFGQTVESAPIAYQRIEGKKVYVECHYVLNENIVSYELGKYDKKYPLVIDPELIFSTSSGSIADNWGNTACVDTEGSLYAGGTIFAYGRAGTLPLQLTGFPATPGAFDFTFNGALDAYVTDIGILKFDSTGTSLEYATYIGGFGTDVPTSMVTNDAGELYILAITSSRDLPAKINDFTESDTALTYFPQTFHGFDDGADLAVIHLSADGSTIFNTRYMGGSDLDGVMVRDSIRNSKLINNYGDQFRGDINVDDEGFIYAASVTASDDFPTQNAAQDRYAGGRYDAVSFKLSPTMDAIEWSTYLGGPGDDAGYSLFRDSLNNVYVAGGTLKGDTSIAADSLFPTTPGVLHEEPLGAPDEVDGFVTAIRNDGSAFLYSTFIGTNRYDQNYFVQLDNAQNVYVFGQTKGVYPTTAGSYQVINGGQYITKMTLELDSVIYSATFGSNNPDTNNIVPNISPTAFLVNECQNVFIAGWGGRTNATYNGGFTRNMFISDGAYKPTSDGSDFYLMVLYQDGTFPLFGTYFGGNVSAEHVDGGTSRFDRKGIVYQSVCAGCIFGNQDFPTFPDDGDPSTYPKRNASRNCNNGVFKYDLANLESGFKYDILCDSSRTARFINTSNGGVDFEWYFGDGNTDFTVEADTVFHAYDTLGTYEVTLIATDLTTCVGKDTFRMNVVIPPSLLPNTIIDTLCQGETQSYDLFPKDPALSFDWSPRSNLSFLSGDSSRGFITADESLVYLVTVRDSLNCEKTDTVDIRVTPRTEANLFVADTCKADSVAFENRSVFYTEALIEYGDGTNELLTETSFSYQYEPKGRFYEAILYVGHPEACNRFDTARQRFYVPEEPVSQQSIVEDCLGNRTGYALIDYIPGSLVQWTPNTTVVRENDSTFSFISDADTEYQISIVDTNACFRLDLLRSEPIDVQFDLDIQKQGNCAGNTPVVLIRNQTNAQNFEWTFSDGSTAFDRNVTTQFADYGTYEIFLRADTAGCVRDTSFMVQTEPIEVPNVFTPNGDGSNERFEVSGIRDTGPWELEIVNRWGDNVFRSSAYQNEWGAVNLEDGVYYYLLTAPDDSFCKGWVYVVR